MPCTRPIPAARKRGGGITFVKRDAWGDHLLELPCGTCKGCRADLAQDWAVRCTHEAALHTNEDGSSKNAFITLTFSDEGLAQREKKEGTHPAALAVRDWQLFAKRLRKSVGPFRFLMSAEYGEGEKRRPHYHALIFGQDFYEDRTIWSAKNGKTCFRSETLEKAWPYGYHDLQQMIPEHINYVCQYVRKKMSAKKGENHESYRRTDIRTGEDFFVPETFALMSRGGKNGKGIGAAWFEKYGRDAFPSDFLVLAGAKRRVPRYYLSRLEAVNPDAALKVRAKRRKRGMEGKDLEENKYQRDIAKEVIQEAKTLLYKRDKPNHIE